jgi:hypothetical protein
MKNSIQNQPFTGAYSIKVDLTPFHAGDRVYLPDTPVLQDKYITAIGVYWNASAVQDPDGDNIGVNDLSDMYLTLVGLDNVNFFQDIPMGYFRQKNRQLDINRYIFLPNCYITLGNPTDKNFLLMTFFYTDKIDCNVLPDAKETNIQPLEVPVFDSPYNQFYLPDNRILVNRKIRNIYSSYIETKAGQPISSSPSGYTLVDPKNTFLTIIYRNDIVIYRMPCAFLQQFDSNFELRFDNVSYDLPSSYVELSKDVAENVGNKACYFNFEYES